MLLSHLTPKKIRKTGDAPAGRYLPWPRQPCRPGLRSSRQYFPQEIISCGIAQGSSTHGLFPNLAQSQACCGTASPGGGKHGKAVSLSGQLCFSKNPPVLSKLERQQISTPSQFTTVSHDVLTPHGQNWNSNLLDSLLLTICAVTKRPFGHLSSQPGVLCHLAHLALEFMTKLVDHLHTIAPLVRSLVTELSNLSCECNG